MDVQQARDLAQTMRRHSTSRGDLSAEVVVPQRREPIPGWHPSHQQLVDVPSERVAVVGPEGRPRWDRVVGGRIVFKGGKKGEHSIDIRASTPERVLSHWQGYCEANGMLKPHVGQRIMFRSGSSPDGFRYGKVAKVGPVRALVTYTFQNGRHATKSVPFHELWWL